jgi:hypothetical protein
MKRDNYRHANDMDLLIEAGRHSGDALIAELAKRLEQKLTLAEHYNEKVLRLKQQCDRKYPDCDCEFDD